jgi:protein SCO1/2
MESKFAALAIAAVVAMLLGTGAVIWLSGRGDALASCSQSTVAGGAAIGGPFELVSETGETVTDVDVIDKPSLVYFGYTYCPDVCPLDAQRNAQVVDLLAEQGVDAKPVFISIDPERDTPEVLAEFTDVMHPEMVGLTGSAAQVKAASQAYRTYYKKQPGDPDYYLVDHSTFTYLVMPQTGFAEFFRRDATAEQMAETVACFAEQG